MPNTDRGNLQVVDGGVGKHETHTYTTSADATSAIAIAPSGSISAGEKQILGQCIISTDTAMNIEIQSSDTQGVERHKFYLAANNSVVFIPRYPIKLPVAQENWNALASVAGNIAISTVTYEE
jgi:adenylosuccinate synthase